MATALLDQRRKSYSFADIETYWQDRWEEARIFHYEPLPGKKNWLIMELPPFANGSLHMGHLRNYSMGDANARFRRMMDFNVLYTSGFDSFGLPNELAAREAQCHPKLLAEEVMAEMRQQFIRMGLSHDTRRIIGYHEEEYYRWVQWVFLKLLENGFAYRKLSPVNWCEHCQTTLADSLAEGGKCWRCHVPVESRPVKQWFISESNFAEELLQGLERLDRWPAKIKQIHRDWIGRREGLDVQFALAPDKSFFLNVFLPQPELLPAVTFIVVSPEHPLLPWMISRGYTGEAALESIRKRTHEAVSTTLMALHPLTEKQLPVTISSSLDLSFNADVLAGCPAHVRADARMALLLGLEAAPVLCAPDGAGPGSAFEWNERWLYCCGGELDGMSVPLGRSHILQKIESAGVGRKTVRYRLRDWNIARQRYWGPPVPVVHCSVCGIVPVPEDQLPVRLPMDISMQGEGNPLANDSEFVHTQCPRCAAPAQRDTDTLEAYSSPWWYHWNGKGNSTFDPFDRGESRLYVPVALMIGGEDQARTCFFHVRMMARALKQSGTVDYEEPIDTLLAIGMVKAGGRKMSKSEGNTVSPAAMIEQYGADAVRFGILSGAAPESDLNWSDMLIRQAYAFLQNVWRFGMRTSSLLQVNLCSRDVRIDSNYSLSRKLARQLETAIVRTTGALEQNRFHLAATNVQFLFKRIEEYESEAVERHGTLDQRDREVLSSAMSVFLRLLTPLCPHITEELWRRFGGSGFIAQAAWPESVFLKADGDPA